MGEMTFSTWQEQACAGCESTLFVQTFALQVKPGGGTISSPRGWRCAVCQKEADIAEMQRAAYLKQRKQELTALEAEIAQTQAPAPAVAHGSRRSSHS